MSGWPMRIDNLRCMFTLFNMDIDIQAYVLIWKYVRGAFFRFLGQKWTSTMLFYYTSATDQITLILLFIQF